MKSVKDVCEGQRYVSGLQKYQKERDSQVSGLIGTEAGESHKPEGKVGQVHVYGWIIWMNDGRICFGEDRCEIWKEGEGKKATGLGEMKTTLHGCMREMSGKKERDSYLGLYEPCMADDWRRGREKPRDGIVCVFRARDGR